MKIEYPKLPKPIKRKWLSALRSGKYKQGRHALYTVDMKGKNPKFCCLGVLATCLGVPKDRIQDRGVLSDLGSMNPKIRAFLDKMEWHEKLDWLEVTGAEGKLTGMNDRGRWSFKRIANWIEKNL